MIDFMCIGGLFDGHQRVRVSGPPHIRIARWENDPHNDSIVMAVEETYYLERVHIDGEVLNLWRHESLKGPLAMLNHILQKYQQTAIDNTAKVPLELASSKRG